MTTTLLRNGHLLTMDPAYGELARADVLITDSRITRIGVDLDAPADETIDCRDHIVLPGFVDTHRHMWQTQLRGQMANSTLLDYAALIRGVYSACYEPDDVYIGILMGYLDALNAGTTTLLDHCHIMNSAEHAAAAIRAFRDSGAGGVFCYGLFPNPDTDNPDSIERVLHPPTRLWDNARRTREVHFTASNDDRIRWGMALSELEFFPIEYSLREIHFARELGAHTISAHAGIGQPSRYTRYVERLGAAGELDKDLLLVHGAALTNRELELMVEHGVALSVTPETELQMGMGLPTLARFAAAGGRAGLGIDIVSNQSSDMFTQMRLALQVTRGLDNQQLARRGLFPTQLGMTVEHILRSATIDGAEALGLADEVGSISLGKRADIIAIRKTDVNMTPVVDATAAVVLYANAGNIATVLTDGVVRKREGSLVGVDLAALTDRLLESTKRVLKRSTAFDSDKPLRAMRQFAPLTRRSSFEQRLAATVFRTNVKPLHDLLIRYALKRAR
ncbi:MULTISPECIES: amidohydrolase family protein [unclassified Nocardia]|uniref:amidohydrolase family protein n=1 Tax=unclassified Nocardia TaxID=2637762 RepID=UPI001CE4402D|nr:MULTISPECIES: amidohydrolase family protein [unclassified Nocardia]